MPFLAVFDSNFYHHGGADPKVIGTYESSSLRHFFWHLAKSNWTYGYRDIKCWENSGAAAEAGAAGGAAAGVHFDSKVLM